MIIGVIGNGNLGKALLKHSGNYRLLECDLLNEQKIKDEIDKVKPDVIINCGAKTNPRWCDNHTVETYSTNTFSVELLAKLYKKRLIHISCDEIFSGNIGKYPETSNDFLPLNTYASSKYFAEVGLRQGTNRNYLIVRTSTLFQKNTPFIDLILGRIKTGFPICGASDIQRSYTYIPHLAQMLDYIVQTDVTGIINLSSIESVSEEAFVKSISDLYNFDKFYATGRTLLDMDYRVSKKCGLDTTKARKIGVPIFSYIDGLVEMKGNE